MGERNKIINVASKDGLIGDVRVGWREESGRPGKLLSNRVDVR